MILSRAKGDGFLSATMVAGDRNQLTGISGKAIKADGTDGAPFTGTTRRQSPWRAEFLSSSPTARRSR